MFLGVTARISEPFMFNLLMDLRPSEILLAPCLTGRHEHLPRLLLIQSKIGQSIESSPVPEDFVFFFDIPATGQVFDVYDILMGDIVHLAELEKSKRASPDRVTAVERKNTERDIITLGHLNELLYLGTHYIWVAESPLQDRLVEDGGEPQRVIPGQHLLPGEPSFHPPLGLAGWHRINLLEVPISHLACIIAGLEQPGNDQGLPAQRGQRFGLHPDQRG